MRSFLRGGTASSCTLGAFGIVRGPASVASSSSSQRSSTPPVTVPGFAQLGLRSVDHASLQWLSRSASPTPRPRAVALARRTSQFDHAPPQWLPRSASPTTTSRSCARGADFTVRPCARCLHTTSTPRLAAGSPTTRAHHFSSPGPTAPGSYWPEPCWPPTLYVTTLHHLGVFDARLLDGRGRLTF